MIHSSRTTAVISALFLIALLTSCSSGSSGNNSSGGLGVYPKAVGAADEYIWVERPHLGQGRAQITDGIRVLLLEHDLHARILGLLAGARNRVL